MLLKKQAVALALFSVVSMGAFAAENLEVDSAHSFVSFKVKHKDLGMAHGFFEGITGKIVYDKENLDKSLVELEIDATSINTGNDARDGHIKKAEYLDVEHFPKITFKSKEIKKISDDKVELTGDVTMKGITKPLTTTISKVGETTDSIGIETQFKLKRSDFKVGKDIGLGDDISIDLAVEAGKPKPKKN